MTEKRYYIDINEELTKIQLIDRNHNWNCCNVIINDRKIWKTVKSFENFNFKRKIEIMAKEEWINYIDIDIDYVKPLI